MLICSQSSALACQMDERRGYSQELRRVSNCKSEQGGPLDFQSIIIIRLDTQYNDVEMWMMMGSDIYQSRRSPPRTIGQMRTIKNLPPDSRLCVQIPTVIKSTAGFRHTAPSASGGWQAQSEMEKLYFIPGHATRVK